MHPAQAQSTVFFKDLTTPYANFNGLNGLSGRGISAALPIPDYSELNILVQALRAAARPAPAHAPLQTLLATVLDMSGSMDNGCAQTIMGYNQQMEKIRFKGQEIGCQVLQVVFSSTAHLTSDFCKPEHLTLLNSQNYRPGGGTTLYDTLIATVKKLLSHPLANDDNTSIMLSINTDGDDTSSLYWTKEQLRGFREIMRAVSENERWTVALAGPDLKLKKFANELSMSFENVAAFKPESIVSRGDVMASSIQAMGSFMNDRSMGVKKSYSMYAGTVSGASAMDILSKKK